MEFETRSAGRPVSRTEGIGTFPLVERRRAGRQEVSPELLPLLRSPISFDGASDWLIPAVAERTDPYDDHDEGPGFIPALGLAIVAGSAIWTMLIWMIFRF